MSTRLTAEMLADLRVPSDLHVSPDGRWATFAVGSASKRDEHDVSAIWLADTSGLAPERQITSGLTNDTSPRWSPDGGRIAFLSDRQERDKPQVHLLPLNGGEARAVTNERGGVRDVQWLAAPSDRLAYLAVDTRPDDIEKRRNDERDDANVFGEFWALSRLHIRDIDCDTSRVVDLGQRHVYSITPSPDGRSIAAILWDTPELNGFMSPSTLAIVDADSAASCLSVDLPFHASSLIWSHTGNALFFIARGGGTDVSSDQLWTIDLREGAEPQLLTREYPYCIPDIARARDASELILNVSAGTESKLVRFSPESGDQRELRHFHGDISGLAVAANGETIAILGSTPERPDDVYAFTRDGAPTRVTNLHRELDTVELGTQEIVSWEREGLTLDGILIYPPGTNRASGPMPTIVSIHGGPYGRWPNEFTSRFGRWLAQHGYLVFLPNARGGEGHGQAFAESVLNTVGNEDYLDIMAGVDMLIERGLADPGRLGCGGWSQGGFMTAWIVGHTDRFKAGVMGAGVSDWGMMIATSDIPNYERLMGGGDPYSGIGPHSFDAQSPISYVHQVNTPVLIVHGENDERVPVSQGIFFHRGLRRFGVPTELVTYPREPHGIRERNHQIDLAHRVIEWYRRWIPIDDDRR